jgi:hypothetical protein
VKELVLNLTPDQLARLDLWATSIQVEPGQLITGITLANLDAFGHDWAEFKQVLDLAVEFYVKKQNASASAAGMQFIGGPPERILRLARRIGNGEISRV